MEHFQSFPKIKNVYSTKQKYCDKVAEVPVIVTEKLHGQNLGFVIDKDQNVYPQKRNTPLFENDPAYNCDNYYTELKPKLLELYNWLMITCLEIPDYICIYGELCGYKQAGCEYTSQKDTYYTTKNQFFVFDAIIVYLPKPKPENTTLKKSDSNQSDSNKSEEKIAKYHIPLDILFMCCDMFDIEHVPVIAETTFSEAQKINVEQVLSILNILGRSDFYMEGIIISSLEMACSKKVILKKKSTMFGEIDTDMNNPEYSNLQLYLTKQRITNVISKDRDLTTNVAKCAQFVVNDAIEEYLVNNPDLLIDEKEKTVKKKLNKCCKKWKQQLMLDCQEVIDSYD